jgi:hypothetical protein
MPGHCQCSSYYWIGAAATRFVSSVVPVNTRRITPEILSWRAGDHLAYRRRAICSLMPSTSAMAPPRARMSVASVWRKRWAGVENSRLREHGRHRPCGHTARGDRAAGITTMLTQRNEPLIL